MTTTRKSIAADLDRAAGRADLVDREPASAKQCWYLAGLLAERGLTADYIDCGCLNTQAVLTKGQAHRWIDALLADKAGAAAGA